jgi:hypothetical protein
MPPSRIAWATARPYAVFCRLKPMLFSSASVSPRNGSGKSRPVAATSRSYAAFADASETCCSRMMWIRVWNPGSRAHSGGGPYVFTTTARSGSRAASCRVALSKDRWVNCLGMVCDPDERLAGC